MDLVSNFVYCLFVEVHNANGGSGDMCKHRNKGRSAISDLTERQLFDMYHAFEKSNMLRRHISAMIIRLRELKFHSGFDQAKLSPRHHDMSKY